MVEIRIDKPIIEKKINKRLNKILGKMYVLTIWFIRHRHRFTDTDIPKLLELYHEMRRIKDMKKQPFDEW